MVLFRVSYLSSSLSNSISSRPLRLYVHPLCRCCRIGPEVSDDPGLPTSGLALSNVPPTQTTRDTKALYAGDRGVRLRLKPLLWASSCRRKSASQRHTSQSPCWQPRCRNAPVHYHVANSIPSCSLTIAFRAYLPFFMYTFNTL